MSEPSKEALDDARSWISTWALEEEVRDDTLGRLLDAFARSRVEVVARQRDAIDKDRQALLDAHMNWERDKRRAVEAEREACETKEGAIRRAGVVAA